MDDEAFMREALAEARRSLDVDEFPAGAIVVLDGEVVGRAHWTGVTDRRLLDHFGSVMLLVAWSGSFLLGNSSGPLVLRRRNLEPEAM